MSGDGRVEKGDFLVGRILGVGYRSRDRGSSVGRGGVSCCCRRFECG